MWTKGRGKICEQVGNEVGQRRNVRNSELIDGSTPKK